MTIKPCNQLALAGHRSRQIEFIEVFSFISTQDLLGRFSPGSARAEVGGGGNLNNRSVASGVRNT